MPVVRLGLVEVLAPFLELATRPDLRTAEAGRARPPLARAARRRHRGSSRPRWQFVNRSRMSAMSIVVDDADLGRASVGRAEHVLRRDRGRGGEPALAVRDQPVQGELGRALHQRVAEVAQERRVAG